MEDQELKLRLRLEKDSNMFKKDYIYAGVIGFITAFFASLIFINSETPLGYGSVKLPLWSLFIILPIIDMWRMY
jgi:hypothetical protein